MLCDTDTHMAEDPIGAFPTWGALVGITVGLVVLLYGVGVAHSFAVQGVGGAVALASFGLLAAALIRLDEAEGGEGH